ncbi:MAG: hypothetical protein K0S18_962 [Anaerocolumna sp.]|nr:hypothetical protein [Anaerocolumna sp.]
MGYRFTDSRIPAGNQIQINGTVGYTYTKSFTIDSIYWGVEVYLSTYAYSYTETKIIKSFFNYDLNVYTTYHTVTAAEAAASYIIYSVPGLYLTFAPSGPFVTAAGKILAVGGVALELGNVIGLTNLQWYLKAGQYTKQTRYYTADYKLHIDIKCWDNYEAYTKGMTPITSYITFNCL